MLYLSQVAEILGGRVLHGGEEVPLRGVCLDSRKARPGDLFFGLRGSRTDGTDHAPEAFRNGAAAAIVERPVGVRAPQIVVEDSVAALGNLAAAYRMTLRARVIAVAGSNGKTTTKEMVAHVLGAAGRVVRAPASYNNRIGLPWTILQADETTDFLVLEVGTSRRGEVAELGEIARPNAAVITSIGPEHLEGLGNVKGVLKENFSLLSFVMAGGFAAVNVDSAGVRRESGKARIPVVRVSLFSSRAGADVYPVDVKPGEGIQEFRVQGVPFTLNLHGLWNVSNALLAIAVASEYGLPLRRASERLAEFRPPRMRMERVRIDGVTFLNDAYNSNPASAENAVRELAGLRAAGRKIAVLGEMAELGTASARFHRRLGRSIATLGGVDVLVGVGGDARWILAEAVSVPKRIFFESNGQAAAYLRKEVRPGDLVLLKGSRRVGLERILEEWVRPEAKAAG